MSNYTEKWVWQDVQEETRSHIKSNIIQTSNKAREILSLKTDFTYHGGVKVNYWEIVTHIKNITEN